MLNWKLLGVPSKKGWLLSLKIWSFASNGNEDLHKGAAVLSKNLNVEICIQEEKLSGSIQYRSKFNLGPTENITAELKTTSLNNH